MSRKKSIFVGNYFRQNTALTNLKNMKKQLLTLLAAFVIPVLSFSQTCYPGWNYYRDITIDNTSGSALTDYQAGLTIQTGAAILAGKLNSDASDLRFSDMACNTLSYYMDSAASSNQNKIWVKVPFIAANTTTTIQLYYGNASATTNTADGDATFIFFDDFEDNSVNVAKWNTFGTYSLLAETGGELHYNCVYESTARYKYVYTVADFNNRVVIDAGVYHDDQHSFGYVSTDDLLSRIYQRPIGNANDTLRLIAVADTTSNGTYAPGANDFPWIPVAQNTMNNLSVDVELISSGLRFHLFKDHTNGETTSGPFDMALPGVTNSSGFKFCLSANDFFGSYSGLSYIKVRQGAEILPTSSFSPEHLTAPVGIQKFSAEIMQVYPNPSYGDFTLNLPSTGHYKAVIKDVTGRISWQEMVEGKIGKISLTGISSGMYSLEVNDGSNFFQKKLVIQ